MAGTAGTEPGDKEPGNRQNVIGAYAQQWVKVPSGLEGS
jgi:hypothetical protein